MKNLNDPQFEKSHLHLLEQVKKAGFSIPDIYTDYLPYADTLSASGLIDPLSDTSQICGEISKNEPSLERAFNEIISVPTLRDLSFSQTVEGWTRISPMEGKDKSEGEGASDDSIRRVAKRWASCEKEDLPNDSLIQLAAKLKNGILPERGGAQNAHSGESKSNEIDEEIGAASEDAKVKAENPEARPIPKLPPLPKSVLTFSPKPVEAKKEGIPRQLLEEDEIDIPTRAFQVRATAEPTKVLKDGDALVQSCAGLSEMMTPMMVPEASCVPLGNREKQGKDKPSVAPNVKRDAGQLQKCGLESSELCIGHVVAHRYEILSEIARGGYGVVYRARQIGIDRVVALKRLKNQNDADVVKRFLLEANIIKNLIHPNTIQLIDAGNDEDNHLYIVMEYIEGRSLQTVLKQKEGMRLQRAVHITMQILKSLNEAHQRGIIHRDLKPSNILLREVIGEPDFVKVLDFGIAKQTRLPVPKLTMDGTILGTPQYIAPELFVGKPPSAASDIYAIGLMLAHMVIGKSLVPSDMMDAARWHHSSEEAELPAWVRDMEIGSIIQKAIRKKPEERYHSVVEMMSDLNKIVHPTSGEYSLIGRRVRLAERSIRRFRMMMIGFLVFLIILLVAAILFL